MFEIGVHVIYRSEGVCTVSDIREENFGAIGGTEKYYILTPIHDDRSTLFVPVNNERLCCMIRKLLSAEEITEMCEELRGVTREWIYDSRARNNTFRTILSEGDRRELIILINTIISHAAEIADSGKRITGGDENTLRRAKSMLYSEFVATTDISSEDDIIPLIAGELKINNK